MPTLNDLENIDDYRRLFFDAGFWSPYVRAVCARHGLALNASEPVRGGIAGTCPVFIAGERWVVKFFGRLFDGVQSFAAEREAAHLTALDSAIRTARLLGEGELGDPSSHWPWPYLIFDYIQSVSIGEVIEQLCLDEQVKLAHELGESLRRLHALPLAGSAGGSPVFPDSWDGYKHLLAEQRAGVVERQRAWGLPEHLLAQIEAFLPTPSDLIPPDRAPHLIHADLTGDHLLGRFEGGRWTSLALIDFGDAMTGSLYYEFGPLHLDLFRADKHLLAAFLAGYGLSQDERAALPHRALATALLHRFNLFERIADQVRRASTLEALAEELYDMIDP